MDEEYMNIGCCEETMGTAQFPQIRALEAATMDTRRRLLREYPRLQDKAIIEHYTSVAAMSVQAMKLIYGRDLSIQNNCLLFAEDYQKSIDIVIAKIKQAQRKDLGLNLTF